MDINSLARTIDFVTFAREIDLQDRLPQFVRSAEFDLRQQQGVAGKQAITNTTNFDFVRTDDPVSTNFLAPLLDKIAGAQISVRRRQSALDRNGSIVGHSPSSSARGSVN